MGAWRVLDGGSPIDASGTLPDGRKFADVSELRALMMEYPEQLVTTMTESLLTYAVGRGLEYYDMPAVRKIVQDAAGQRLRFPYHCAGYCEQRSVPDAAGPHRRPRFSVSVNAGDGSGGPMVPDVSMRR